VRTIGGAEILNDEIVFQQGAHTWHRYWLRGWHRILGHSAKWIVGLTGEETVIDLEEIRPVRVVDVQ
jgi:hypothetical protein